MGREDWDGEGRLGWEGKIGMGREDEMALASLVAISVPKKSFDFQGTTPSNTPRS